MDNLIIPPNPNWFSQSICYCTPDNGLIYGATSKIAYIPPRNEQEVTQMKILDLKKKLNCFALCPNYNDTKRIALINGDYQVLVYNFQIEEIIKGHKGHCDELNKQYQFSAITFTSSNIVLSSLNSDVIKFCLLTNTFKSYPDFSNRNPITILKKSPKDCELVAAGTKNGLILLIDSEKMEIKARLRGQDSEITSLDFMVFPVIPKDSTKINNVKRAVKQSVPVDDSDIFDIYKTDKIEDEFGAFQENVEDRSDDEETNEAEMKEKVHNTTDFNFLEACSDLKYQILCRDGENSAPGNRNSGTFDDNKEQYGMKNEDTPSVDVSIASNRSSHTPVFTEESLNYIDECQRLKELDDKSKDEDIVVLASGSRECVVWLWDIIEHTALHKIRWHPKAKNLLPAIFTNVLWLNKEILLFTDNNGEVVEHKIKFDERNKKVTDQRQKRTYDVKGVLNICKSNDSSLLWMSSIHRHICCLETQNLTKIISLDTLQIRIHYIIENPIESNVIAIGGNDKRLCLWNTSDASRHMITLKPFMNKIQSSILCIAWHPEKDNILAFSTREGRVGILDTNKFTNVPVIMESFTSHEIYSMTWAKFTDSSGLETTVLVVCSNGKCVYYNYKDFKINLLPQFKNICSLASNMNLLALGNSNGTVFICDMSKNFKVIAHTKICQKYIGMMTWFNDKLAIASEKGITIIKDLNEGMNEEIAEENKIKLQQQKRVYSVRFNKNGDHLVSSNITGSINVWNLETSSIIASMNIDTPAYCAIFMPNNEDVIICGGQDSTVHTFEWKQHPLSQEVAEKSSKNDDKLKHMEWGMLSEMTTISKYNKKRRVKKKMSPNNKIADITNGIKQMKVGSKKITTIFTAANREISVNPLNFIQMILTGNDGRELSMNEVMFGNRDDVKKMIDRELENDQKSFGTIILPQLTDDLKDDILERIENKTLTEVHVSISPSISYDLWKKSCLAYGKQCIDSDEFIRAVPYLLAVNEVDNCVDMLCESKYFREAWVIAKLRKDEKDPVYDKIMQKWISYLDYSGNYETSAALLCCTKDYKRACEALEKRQNKDEKFMEIFNILSSKV